MQFLKIIIVVNKTVHGYALGRYVVLNCWSTVTAYAAGARGKIEAKEACPGSVGLFLFEFNVTKTKLLAPIFMTLVWQKLV